MITLHLNSAAEAVKEANVDTEYADGTGLKGAGLGARGVKVIS